MFSKIFIFLGHMLIMFLLNLQKPGGRTLLSLFCSHIGRVVHYVLIFSVRSQCRQLHSHRVKRLLPAAGDGVQLDRMVRLVQRLVLVRWLVGVADLVVCRMRLMRWLFVRRLPGDQGRRQH